ncbi:hypothetical protein G6O67_003356 [Ophiocordyceps sinensis]|uniref:Uncharacterized protein n=2 Tax=Ophiocordyceps sinensis TaxID=72228 RepID=A0A8H4PW35_9HYPO|nr:hypothetical protein OCS_00488 [Ophiocordyceps sinensis CO18]KAF4511574.1 hypothetical protein G6O67_003356 [Ophiocordyceps sinensis]
MRTAIAVGLTRIPMTITLLPRPDPDELEQDPEDDVPIDWLLAAELTNRGYTSRWSTTRRIQWRLNESSLPITKEYTCNGLLAPDSIYTATSRSIRRSALASAILASRSLAPKYASWKAHNEEELDEWKVSLHQQGFDMANGKRSPENTVAGQNFYIPGSCRDRDQERDMIDCHSEWGSVWYIGSPRTIRQSDPNGDWLIVLKGWAETPVQRLCWQPRNRPRTLTYWGIVRSILPMTGVPASAGHHLVKMEINKLSLAAYYGPSEFPPSRKSNLHLADIALKGDPGAFLQPKGKPAEVTGTTPMDLFLTTILREGHGGLQQKYEQDRLALQQQL